MSGAFKAVGDIVGGVAQGVTKTVGGVLKGAGQVLTGNPIEGLKTAVGGVVQGSAADDGGERAAPGAISTQCARSHPSTASSPGTARARSRRSS